MKAKLISRAVCSPNLPLAPWGSQATTAQSQEGMWDQCPPPPKGSDTVLKLPRLTMLSNTELGVSFPHDLAAFPKG